MADMAERDLRKFVLEFGVSVVACIVTGYQDGDDQRRGDLLNLAEQVLQFAVLAADIIPDGENFVTCIRDLVNLMTSEQEDRCFSRRGRPVITIEKDQLAFLCEQGFRIKDIAEMFGCCTKTIERRLNKYGISSNKFADLTNEQLDVYVQQISSLHPHLGEKSVNGRLKSQGIVVQRDRIRESMRRVDPTGVQSRARRALHRRTYSVCAPNELWHLDGYHKLIRWRVVIHGGIDGLVEW